MGRRTTEEVTTATRVATSREKEEGEDRPSKLVEDIAECGGTMPPGARRVKVGRDGVRGNTTKSSRSIVREKTETAVVRPHLSVGTDGGGDPALAHKRGR